MGPTRAALGTTLLALAGLLLVGALAHAGWFERPVPAAGAAGAAGAAYAADPDRAPSTGLRAYGAGKPPPFLLVVVDGLREEVFAEGATSPMPRLLAFAERGARGVATTGEPTMSAPCVRTLLTGRLPDLYTAFHNFDALPTRGSLVEAFALRGARAAHAGDATIPCLVGRWYDPQRMQDLPHHAFPGLREKDDLAFPAALSSAEDPAVDLLTVHLVAADLTGHAHGADGPEYAEACRTIDGRVEEIVSSFLARRPGALVLVAADHGLSPRGTHGSGEAAARRAPFVLVGPRVAPLAGAEVSQAALAPTVALLAGLSPPPLAEAPPAFELTTVPLGERAAFLDAYVRARIEVARSLGAEDVAAAVDARRARAFAADGARALEDLAATLRDLDERVFRGAGTASRWAAVAVAVLLAVLLAGLVTRGAAPPRASLSRGALGVAGALLGLGVVAGGVFAVRASLVGASDPGPAALRLGAVVALGAVLVFATGRRFLPKATGARPPWRERVVAFAERHPAGLLLAVGAAVALPLTLRLAIDDVVHLPIPYAVLGVLAVLALATSPAARRAPPGAGAVALVAAVVLFLGGRAAAGLLGADWASGPAGSGVPWRLATGLAVGLLALDAARGRLRGGGARLSAALAVLVVLHAVLARESDATGAAFALFAVLSRAASEIAGPASRGGLALWSVGLLAVHVATFHALGHDHTLGAVDLGGALVPRTGTSGAGAETAAVPWGSVLALAARFALAWGVLLLASFRSLSRSPVPGVAPLVVAGLAVALAGGGIAIAVVLPAWWTWAWWGVHAWAVYALLLVDLALLLPFSLCPIARTESGRVPTRTGQIVPRCRIST